MPLRIALSLITLALTLCIVAMFVIIQAFGCSDCEGMYNNETVTAMEATNNQVRTAIAGTATAIATIRSQ